jgi:FixJ family two-component response regulator
MGAPLSTQGVFQFAALPASAAAFAAVVMTMIARRHARRREVAIPSSRKARTGTLFERSRQIVAVQLHPQTRRRMGSPRTRYIEQAVPRHLDETADVFDLQ